MKMIKTKWAKLLKVYEVNVYTLDLTLTIIDEP